MIFKAAVSILAGLFLSPTAQALTCVEAMLSSSTEIIEVPKQILILPQPENVDRTRNALLTLRQSVVASGLGDLANVRTLVYPMSGPDAGTPAVLFPNATVIIGVDSAAFAHNHDGPWQVKSPKILGLELGYATYRDMDNIQYEEEEVAAHLVQSLRAFIPDFRLRKITMFSNKHGFADGWDGSTNGIIEFDSGEGTLVRRFIHVNDYVSNLFDATAFPKAFQLDEPFKIDPPDAVYVRASMGRIGFEDHPGAFRTKAIGWLRNTHGFLVEGEEQIDDQKPQKPLPELSGTQIFEGSRRQVFPKIGIGYTGTIHVTKF